MFSSVIFSPINSPATSPRLKTSTRSLIEMTSGMSEETIRMALSFLQEVDHDLVDFLLRPDVDAVGGLIENENFATGVEPLAEHNLLLVAAGEVDRSGPRTWRLDGQELAIFLADRELVGRTHHEFPGVHHIGDRDVLGDGLGEEQAGVLTILGDEAHLVADRVLGTFACRTGRPSIRISP